MGIGKFFSKKKELPLEDNPGYIEPVDTFREDILKLNGERFRIGTLRLINISRYPDIIIDQSSYRTFDPIATLEVNVNLFNLFPSISSQIPVNYIDYHTLCTAPIDPNISKIRLSDKKLEEDGINEVDIHSCKLIFTISKSSLGLQLNIHQEIEVERKFNSNIESIMNNLTTPNGIQKVKVHFPNRINYRLSDIFQIDSVFNSMIPIIRDTIDRSFYQEMCNLKDKISKEKIIREFNNLFNDDSINDIFAHVIDILGNPTIYHNKFKNGKAIGFSGGSSGPCNLIKGSSVEMDDKMNMALYEITESINKIKGLYNKAKVSFELNSTHGIIIQIYPDIIEYEIPSSPSGTISCSIQSGFGATSSYISCRGGIYGSNTIY